MEGLRVLASGRTRGTRNPPIRFLRHKVHTLGGGKIAACHLIEYGVMTAVAADLYDHGNLVASVFNFFSLPLVQSNPSLLWSSQSTKFGSSINMFPNRRSLTEVRGIMPQYQYIIAKSQ